MRQKGVIQLIPLLLILLIGSLVVIAAVPGLKGKLPTAEAGSPAPTKSATPKPSTTPKPTTTAAPVVTSNQLPASGYSTFNVQTDVGTFRIAVGAADVTTTRVVVDTASDSDCTNDCPTFPLATYIQRRNAYAGINGTYFCPAEYPSCAGQTGSFNFLVMNINKYYFNSSQNVYSTNPVAIFASGYVTFLGQAQQWGRDTGPDGVISNYPMLVQRGNIAFAGSGDPKINVKTTRSFVANKGNTVYIGDVFGASTSDAAHVLKTLGIDNALNLDDAGSAAFWWGGYKVGPGRNIPNAILFIQR